MKRAYKILTGDLKDIYCIFGEFTVTDEAKVAINRWGEMGGPPRPDHPKLAHYVTRRMAHLLKLCMIACAATDSERIITIDHFAEALDWMVESETFMPDIFKALKVGGDARAIEECWHFAYQYWMKHKAPVPEHMIVMFLQERVPAHSIKPILDAMVRGQLLTAKMLNSGGQGYEPKTRSV